MSNNCIGCDKLKIVIDELGYTEAKCGATSKRGRVITWAHTVYNSYTDAVKGDLSAHGKDRVNYYLKTRKNRPKWCPLNK